MSTGRHDAGTGEKNATGSWSLPSGFIVVWVVAVLIMDVDVWNDFRRVSVQILLPADFRSPSFFPVHDLLSFLPGIPAY